jgi:antitoxin component of RelBE/YafQ-DinJ toxin-antitoxin module
MKIQITVDDSLGKQIQRGASELGLSISSYARSMLKNSIKESKPNLLDKALKEESISTTLEDFRKEIKKLKNA